MKTLDSMQRKLQKALKKHSHLKIYPEYPWRDPQLFDEIVWVVEDYLNRNGNVITDTDELVDWLDEWKFFIATRSNQ